jgi:hypothetical protein
MEEARMVFQLSVELGGHHEVQDDWNTVTVTRRDGTWRSAAAQTTPAPPAITRTVIAATKLSTVTDVPLYFKAVSVTLPSGEKSSVSVANSIVYQISGSTEVSLDGETKMLNAGEGLFIVGGKMSVLKAGSGGPSSSSTSSLPPPRTWIGLPSRHLPPCENYIAQLHRSPT